MNRKKKVLMGLGFIAVLFILFAGTHSCRPVEAAPIRVPDNYKEVAQLPGATLYRVTDKVNGINITVYVVLQDQIAGRVGSVAVRN